MSQRFQNSVIRYGMRSASSAQTVPTYDGSGQLVHPDIQYVAGGWGQDSRKYWMAFTPYPAADSTKENPSVVSSDDGESWAVPTGLTNPIIAAQEAPTHNSDPDLLIWTNNVAYLTYIVSDTTTTNGIMLTTSSDGVTWTAPTCILAGINTAFRSQAMVWNGTTCVLLWSTQTGTVKYSTCSTPDGTWGSATTIYPYFNGDAAWHQDLAYSNGVYWLFESTFNDHYYLLNSSDLLHWNMLSPVMLGPTGAASWDDSEVYRGTFLPLANGTFDCWYTGVHSSTWKIGRTIILKNN